jgi:hypothetical protein
MKGLINGNSMANGSSTNGAAAANGNSIRRKHVGI